ncbi:protein vestigial [Microplitis mediator]|uniref:protein vestigial n=1 Tax=Microplitis mediator TaxID=375433 RepID=UPI002553A6A9|nr:protein vestigial [Microplitis mediator]XP_057326401.1 protein vestigial [Microplitis mediator]
MSCSEVMYQYYPYLYQRPPPPPHPSHPHAAPHPHPHANPHTAHHSPARPAPFQPFSATATAHQYDRINVHQRSLEAAAGLELCAAAAVASGSVPQGQPSSAGSVGSAPSPASPRPTPQSRQQSLAAASQPSRTLDDDRSTDGPGTTADDSDDGESRAQYVNANCVVFTHYRGDAASEVEEHFQRALAHDKVKENIPMSTRNFPPSFWNSQHPGDVYEYPTDPWHPHYPQYHHRAVHEYHHHNMAAAASYGGLLLGGARSLGHHTSHHAAHHAHAAAASYKDWTSATPSQSLVDASSAPPYHGPYAPLSGLDPQVQDSKDLYWF